MNLLHDLKRNLYTHDEHIALKIWMVSFMWFLLFDTILIILSLIRLFSFSSSLTYII